MRSGRRIFSFPVVAAALLVLQSFVLLRFPLLNVLGLEFSVASAPLVSLLTAIAALRTLSASGDLTHPYRRLLDVLRPIWFVPLLPGVLAAVNAVFVTNCDPWSGLAYYLLIVPLAAAYGAALAILVVAVVPGTPRTITIVLWLLTLLHILVTTFFGPQIFAYNPIVGFFPGLTYDSTLSAIPSLLGYRVTTLLLISAMLETARLASGGHMNGWREVLRRSARLLGLSLVLVAVWIFSDRLGFSSSMSRIERELGGVLRTEHFLIVYPEHRLTTEEAERFGEYHEYVFHFLSRTLRVRPSRPIVSVYYESSAQKTALVGGGSTHFTKPWLWQMHLGFDDRERVLRHEMVHVLAAEFGFPLLRIGLNSGFIEGLAVALERESYGMSLDRAAVAIRTTLGGSDLSSVFSLTGFFRSHAAVSYTLAGSFCRFLVERYGIRRFKRAYRSGTFTSYGRTFEQLEEEWERSLARIELSDGEVLKARYLFDRRPSFAEECFHYKGNTLRMAREAIRDGQDSLAAAIAEEVYRRSPSSEAAYIRAQALLGNGRPEEALGLVRERLLNERDSAFLPYWLVQADALWMMDSARQALQSCDRLIRADLSDGWTETAVFRQAVMRAYGRDPDVRGMVIGTEPDSVRRDLFRQRVAHADDPLIWYGLSRLLGGEEFREELRDVLPRAKKVKEPFLRFVVLRRLAALYSREHDYEKAKAVLWEAQNEVSDEIRLRELVEGIEWQGWLKVRLSSR